MILELSAMQLRLLMSRFEPIAQDNGYSILKASHIRSKRMIYESDRTQCTFEGFCMGSTY